METKTEQSKIQITASIERSSTYLLETKEANTASVNWHSSTENQGHPSHH